jgi:hypothetical protein
MAVRIFGVASTSNSAEDFRLAAAGLWVPSSQINARTGVTSAPVLTGTGSFTCTVGAFSCVIDGTSNSLQGSYPVSLDTATTVTINAASAQARIDLISLQMKDNAYDGSGLQQGQITYTAGTPGSGIPPSAPANSISLFTVPVGASASSVNFASATAVYPYTAAAGGIVPVRSAADQPAAVAGVQYRHRLDVSAGGTSPTEWSVNGTTWNPVYDSTPNNFGTWTNCGLGTAFNVIVQPQYRTAPGNKIELRGQLITNTSLASGGGVLSGIPAPSTSRTMAFGYANQAGSAYLQIGSGNNHAEILFDGTFPFNRIVAFDGVAYSL